MADVKIGISRVLQKSTDPDNKSIQWNYFASNGSQVTDPEVIDRCNKLVLPPAWENVWISENPNSDLQATGYDSKGRLQYRYHQNWIQQQAEKKFQSTIWFAEILPAVRKQVEKDLVQQGMPKVKVIALIIKLMDLYHIRVGNDEYARKNNSYGLTTLKEGHVIIDKSRHAEGRLDAVLEFRGKSGKDWKIRIWEDDLAILIEQSGNVGGNEQNQDLFRYEDGNGRDYDIKSFHINEYLDHAIPGKAKATAKDFRTWAATWKTANRLSSQIDPETVAGRKKVANQVIKTVASDLGNTVSVCRSSYIHPAILDDWHNGSFRKNWNSSASKRKVKGLSKEETITLCYLKQHTK